MANYILNLSVVNDEVSDTANVEIIIPDSDNDTRETIIFAVTRDDNQEYYCFTLTNKGMEELIKFYQLHKTAIIDEEIE